MRYEHSYYFLAHHGIQGQKWGVRNGPPYPLSEGQKRQYTGKQKETKHERAIKNIEKQQQNRKKGDINAFRLASDAAFLVSEVLMPSPYILYPLSDLGLGAYGTIREQIALRKMVGKEIEKKTGLRLKDEKDLEMTQKQDARATNPGFRNFSTNTKSNCVLCTNSYELRRRGFDVIAEKDNLGYGVGDIKRWFPDAKLKVIREYDDVRKQTTLGDPKKIYEYSKEHQNKLALDKDATKAIFGFNKNFSNQIISTLEKEPNGSRGNLLIGWGRGGGHSVAYEIQDNKLVIIDAQSGTIYRQGSLNSLNSLFNNCTTASYYRLDNVGVNPKTIKECCR